FGDRLDRRGEVSGFSQAQHEPSYAETHHRARQRMTHRRNAPKHHRQRKALPGSEAVHQTAHPQQPDCVSHLEEHNDPTVLDLAPTYLCLKSRLQYSNALAIDVIDRGREEQKCANDPAVPAGRGNYFFGSSGAGPRGAGFVNRICLGADNVCGFIHWVVYTPSKRRIRRRHFAFSPVCGFTVGQTNSTCNTLSITLP